MAQIAPHAGVDVSKDLLDVGYYPGEARFRVSNDAAGWRELAARLQQADAVAIGIEPSGGYERGVISALLQAGLPVRLVNSWKLRQFAPCGRVAGEE